MRNLEGENPFFSAHSRIVGVNMATIGVLLRKADMPITGAIIRKMLRRSPLPCPISRLAKISRIPEDCAA